MVSGGARARSGPVADLNSYRSRRDKDGWVNLPETVNRRRSPNWPLEPKASPRESELWRSLWRQGQSIMWEKNRQQMQVALYVRLFASVEGEPLSVPASLITQQRIISDSLGISMDGLARLRWRFTTPEALEKQIAALEKERTPSRRKSSAEQLAGFFPSKPDDDSEA